MRGGRGKRFFRGKPKKTFLKDIKIPREPNNKTTAERSQVEKTFLSDLVSNSLQAGEHFPSLCYFPPAVRNNLWDDKARILNNQSHFPFFSLPFNLFCVFGETASPLLHRKHSTPVELAHSKNKNNNDDDIKDYS